MPWNCIQCSIEILLMSTIIRSFAGSRSFHDVREGAGAGRYQRCAANVAPVAPLAARHFRVIGGNTTTWLTTCGKMRERF
jgi:hypothetical protein